MEDIGENGSEKIGDNAVEPEEFVVVKNDPGEESVDNEVKDS